MRSYLAWWRRVETVTVLAPGSKPGGCRILGFFASKKNRRFHRKLPEISSNRLSVEDIVSTSTDKRKIGDISPIFGEILFLAYGFAFFKNLISYFIFYPFLNQPNKKSKFIFLNKNRLFIIHKFLLIILNLINEKSNFIF